MRARSMTASPRHFGEKIAAAGEGRTEAHVSADGGLGDCRRGLVLAHLVRLDASCRHPREAGRFEGSQVRRGKPAALLQGDRADAQAVRQDRTFALLDRKLAEDHAFSPAFSSAFSPVFS